MRKTKLQFKKWFTHAKAGFTLIELLVATSIFMVIMLMAMGALVTTSDSAKKSQADRSAIDNVNFAMESMTRSIRMGSDYSCIATISNIIVGTDPTTQGEPSHDCINGGGAFVFTSANSSNLFDTMYVLKERSSDNGLPVTHVLQRCNTTNCVDIVSSDVDVKELKFFVKGNEAGDLTQPSVYIIMKGTVTVHDQPITFALQTMASQRSTE